MGEPRNIQVYGFNVLVDDDLGHLAVSHNDDLDWDTLQVIKNKIWGENARAIEVYPRQSELVNNANLRHLWRLGVNDFCPDLLGREENDDLQTRFVRCWAKADSASK